MSRFVSVAARWTCVLPRRRQAIVPCELVATAAMLKSWAAPARPQLGVHVMRLLPPQARSGPPLLLATTLFLLPLSASAGDPGTRSPTWDLAPDELAAIGLGQSRGDPVPVPEHAPKQKTTLPGAPQAVMQG